MQSTLSPAGSGEVNRGPNALKAGNYSKNQYGL